MAYEFIARDYFHEQDSFSFTISFRHKRGLNLYYF